MELIDLLRIVRRWLWLIVAIVVVTELALWFGTKSAEPVYTATVGLQISTPQREDVAAYDEYRSISLRDEITVAINNFVELVESDDVRQRTISQLGLGDTDSDYTVTVERVTDADFVNVTVEARTPSLAAEIANTHVDIAIAYYGELRAKTTNAEKNLFAEQLRVAEEEFHTAEMTLADFRSQNGIYSLESQMSTQQRLLEQLQLERDQRLLDQATAVTTTTEGAVVVTPTPTVDPVEEVDKLIAQRQQELEKFTTLAPQYNILSQKVEEARTAYQHLLSKYSEAELKVTAVQAANFIQVIKPAYAPAESDSNWSTMAVLALVGSLGLGVMLAILLQYIYGFKTVGEAETVSEKPESSPRKRRKKATESKRAEVSEKPESPSRKRRKKAAEGDLSEVTESGQKTLLRGDIAQSLWKRIRGLFHRNGSASHEDQLSSENLDDEQEQEQKQEPVVASPNDSAETEAM